jgi:hypothetical protein
MTGELRLHIGRRYTGIRIVRWRFYPGMWRVAWPDGQVSPMGNMARAKDAALTFARRMPGFGGRQVHRWECTGSALEPPRVAEGGVVTDPGANAPVGDGPAEPTRPCALCKVVLPESAFPEPAAKNCTACRERTAARMAAKGQVKHPKPETKRCVTCGEEKPYDSYERDRNDCPAYRAKEAAAKAAAQRKPPMPFDQEVADRVLERVAMGEPMYRIHADEAMPSRHQLHAWKVTNEAFAKALAEARRARADSRIDRMEEIADEVRTGKLDPNAGRVVLDQLKWVASREDPAAYGDRVKADVQVTDLSPQKPDSDKLTILLAPFIGKAALEAIEAEAAPVALPAPKTAEGEVS